MQFNIRSMLLMTLAIALGMVLVRQLSFIGAAILFVAAIALSSAILRSKPKGSRLRNESLFWLFSIWGVLMPLACLAADPFLFRNQSQVKSIGWASYIFIGWEMLALFASLYVPRKQRYLNSLFCGVLFAGAVYAMVIAMVLFLPAAIFSLFFIGLAGFTPIFTSAVYFYASRLLWTRTRRTKNQTARWGLMCTGFLTSIVVGGFAFLGLYQQYSSGSSWIE